MPASTPLSYTETGSGPAVVLLHAFPLNATVWKPLQEKLSNRYRVIAVDLPGFGGSQPPRPFTLDSAVDDLHALLRNLGALPCTLVGLSLGGYFGFAFADRHMDALAKLVLIDTKAAGDSDDAKAGRNAMIETARRQGTPAVAQQMLGRLLSDESRQQQPALVQQLLEVMHAASPATLEYALTAMRDRPDRSSVLGRISVPTLLVVGEHDKVIPPAVVKELHEQIRGSQLAILPGAGHVSALEQPAAFEQVFVPFLQA